MWSRMLGGLQGLPVGLLVASLKYLLSGSPSFCPFGISSDSTVSSKDRKWNPGELWTQADAVVMKGSQLHEEPQLLERSRWVKLVESRSCSEMIRGSSAVHVRASLIFGGFSSSIYPPSSPYECVRQELQALSHSPQPITELLETMRRMRRPHRQLLFKLLESLRHVDSHTSMVSDVRLNHETPAVTKAPFRTRGFCAPLMESVWEPLVRSTHTQQLKHTHIWHPGVRVNAHDALF
ncbi:hypothetical protein DNTS_009589 [Danionella cerebrum]|uniref:Uncharacterized protein n=1 Tax=Danionella cerebrum TaxID=2873325 RepID=A0A553NN38_9TELE|nr:hypothetical protein DNTS_009589 [Danionella translucida]